jgi:NADH-quinone oxidoreductase subunit N
VRLSLLVLLVLTLLAELVLNSPIMAGGGAFTYLGNTMMHSMLTYCMKVGVLFFSICTVAYVDTHEAGMSARVIGLMGAIIFFALILVASNNLVVLYIAVEGVSLLAYVLTASPKTSVSVEAAIKYFFQSSFASVMMLLGIVLIYLGTKDLNFLAVQAVMAQGLITYDTVAGIALVTIAFLFKIASFPGHF